MMHYTHHVTIEIRSKYGQYHEKEFWANSLEALIKQIARWQKELKNHCFLAEGN